MTLEPPRRQFPEARPTKGSKDIDGDGWYNGFPEGIEWPVEEDVPYGLPHPYMGDYRWGFDPDIDGYAFAEL